MRRHLLELVVRELESVSRGVVADVVDVERAFAFELRVLEALLRGVVLEVVEVVLEVVEVVLEVVEVEEDSTALASAIETLAFSLAKTVSQTLIAFFTCVQTSYSWLQHHSATPNFSPGRCDGDRGQHTSAFLRAGYLTGSRSRRRATVAILTIIPARPRHRARCQRTGLPKGTSCPSYVRVGRWAAPEFIDVGGVGA